MESIEDAVTRSMMRLIVNPTEQCNLRCRYCYETFSLKEMPEPIRRGVVNLISRRAELGLQLLELEFFGGEPLAAWNVVCYLSQKVKAACDKHGTKLVGRMTTNGTLLDKQRLDVLIKFGISIFQITLDGPPEYHDARRVNASGRGSFGAVWAALCMMKASEHKLSVIIRVHHDPATVGPLIASGFVRRIVEDFVTQDDRFQLHFHAIHRWGGVHDATLAVYEKEEDGVATKRLAQAAVEWGALPAQVPQLNMSDAVGEAGLTICYAARANAFIIRSDGRVGKCTVAFEDERNTVGLLTENGELIIDHDRHLPWLRGLLSGNAAELSCPARHVVWSKEEFATLEGGGIL